ncbi:hypothetical protein HDF25_003775 [Pedobacter cryoconitis]|uniref:Uncharacterized protein n=1 Tax=Pedobacter cryoconitis TaxID=188932 RepID=A0A7X0J686_9SPHI|nr:hypothetical protein [Pedobacter cryoconitis]
MARCWYAFGGTGDPTLAGNYRLLHQTPGCLDGTQICAIYAMGCGTVPVSPLSTNIVKYIHDGLSNLVAEPQLPIFSKLFVYLRNP